MIRNKDYFEGTLQLRKCSEEIYEYVSKRMVEEKVTIAKHSKSKNGDDYKISSNKFMMKLANELERKYSGIATISRKLFTRNRTTGKEVYRMTMKFEELPFKVGDMVDNRGEAVKVLSIGKKITVRDSKGKRFFYQFK